MERANDDKSVQANPEVPTSDGFDQYNNKKQAGSLAARVEPDWQLLSESDDEGDYAFSVSDVNAAIVNRLDQIDALLDELRVIETAHARQTASDFTQWRRLSIKSPDNDEFGSFITRVVRKGMTLTLQWLTISYFKNKSGASFPRSKYITKQTRGYSYPKSIFNDATSWEKQIVYGVEGRYSLIRERWTMLSGITSLTRKYRKRLTDPDETLISSAKE